MKTRFLLISLLTIIFSITLLSLNGATIQLKTTQRNIGTPLPTPEVKLGIDVLLESRLNLVKGKRVGLVTNQSGVNRFMVPTMDVMHEHPEINLTALFGPEHGIRGAATAGEKVKNYIDSHTGLMVYSLYGDARGPNEEMVKDIDILVFDIQDIGSRSYTYISTMAECMKSAAKFNIPLIILDRPNPLGGEMIDGNILDPEWTSFIGIYPIPYCHGMTVGELALYFNTEFEINCDLAVVKMKNWKRRTLWQDTGLGWVPTSPHIPRAITCLYYPLTGNIGELHTINTGVGYTLPFELIGDPTINSYQLADELNKRMLPGVYFQPTYYKPYYHAREGEVCGGVQIVVTNQRKVMPIEVELHIIEALQKYYPDALGFGKTSRRGFRGFDRSYGTDEIRKRFVAGDTAESIIASYQQELRDFRKDREPYLLY
jgi:uncharacterized protein YbbC (DUF1343 family)